MTIGIDGKINDALKEVIRDLLLNGLSKSPKRHTRRTAKRKGGARKLSAAGRRAISRAAKARWRKYHAENK